MTTTPAPGSAPGRPPGPALARRLGLGDAVFIGLGSMIGAGVFSVWGPAASAAGRWLLLGLVVAAFVAFCNAAASAQLAAVHPTSGGTYAYGRAVLGPWWGYLAGWCFVIGKTASCAAMALTFAAYAVPDAWQKPVAALAVLTLGAVNSLGVTRTALVARVVVVLVLVALAVAVGAGWRFHGLHEGWFGPIPVGTWYDGSPVGSPWGILQAAGLLFFAFAGYARVATMGEEVREPRRTIPRAILIALGITVAIYLAIGATLLVVVHPWPLAHSAQPLIDLVHGEPVSSAVVRVGAALAALGALLGLVAGVGRTTLAMAREGDLPRWLAAVHPRFRTPHHAELALAVVTAALVLLVDVRGAIGFSSFGVLLYYFVANAAALRQPVGERRFPRWLQAVGAAGCVALAFSLPWASIVAGIVVVLIGVAWRLAALRGRAARG